jgi:hypothetical protein
MHIAGRADEVGLPIVAEIMNAKSERAAVNLVHRVEGTGRPVAMKGAWRLWCEHGGDARQVQGQPLRPFTTTNPAHVFEIHPITALDGRSLLDSLRPIEGFKTKDAEQAFTRYENISCELIPGDDSVTIRTGMAGFNYVEFVMETNSPQQEVEDGRMVLAKVLDLQGELLIRNRRMAFVKDSAPEAAVRNLSTGGRLHVVGIPRINLTLVDWRVQHSGERPDALRWRLPYEIIVAGVYPDRPEAEEEEEVAERAAPAAPPPAALAAPRAPAAPPIGMDALRQMIREELRQMIREELRDFLREGPAPPAGVPPAAAPAAPAAPRMPAPGPLKQSTLNEEEELIGPPARRPSP